MYLSIKNKLLTLLFVLLTGFTFAQKADTLNRYNQFEQKTGTWVTYEPIEGDTIKTVCYYKNNEPQGTLVSYYPNKQIMCTVPYKNGLQHGRVKYYFKSGVIKDIYLIDEGKIRYHIKFTPEGKIFLDFDGSKVTLYQDGKPQ